MHASELFRISNPYNPKLLKRALYLDAPKRIERETLLERLRAIFHRCFKRVFRLKNTSLVKSCIDVNQRDPDVVCAFRVRYQGIKNLTSKGRVAQYIDNTVFIGGNRMAFKQNTFSYRTKQNFKHYLFWTKNQKMSQQQAIMFVKNFVAKKEFGLFEQEQRFKSVPEFRHWHVFVNKDMTFAELMNQSERVRIDALI